MYTIHELVGKNKTMKFDFFNAGLTSPDRNIEFPLFNRKYISAYPIVYYTELSYIGDISMTS